ncbi:MAG: GntR family transcriptional regulator [Thermodesulfobacteriota bacterium]
MEDLHILLKSDSEKPSREGIVRLLREAIYSGQLPPGMRLIESELAEKMQVGRTPLREAIRQLEAEELIKVVPNKGATVVSYSRDDMREIYRICAVLEGMAASLAVENLSLSELDKIKTMHTSMETRELQAEMRKWFLTNRELHSVYLRCCQSPRLLKLIKQQISQLDRYWFILLSIPGMMEQSVSQHTEIIHAFEKRDSDLVRRLVEDHILSVGFLLVAHLESIYPAVF